MSAYDFAGRPRSGDVYMNVYPVIIHRLDVTLGAYQLQDLVDRFPLVISFPAAKIATLQLAQASDTGDYGGFTDAFGKRQGFDAFVE